MRNPTPQPAMACRRRCKRRRHGGSPRGEPASSALWRPGSRHRRPGRCASPPGKEQHSFRARLSKRGESVNRPGSAPRLAPRLPRADLRLGRYLRPRAQVTSLSLNRRKSTHGSTVPSVKSPVKANCAQFRPRACADHCSWLFAPHESLGSNPSARSAPPRKQIPKEPPWASPSPRIVTLQNFSLTLLLESTLRCAGRSQFRLE